MKILGGFSVIYFQTDIRRSDQNGGEKRNKDFYFQSECMIEKIHFRFDTHKLCQISCINLSDTNFSSSSCYVLYSLVSLLLRCTILSGFMSF